MSLWFIKGTFLLCVFSGIYIPDQLVKCSTNWETGAVYTQHIITCIACAQMIMHMCLHIKMWIKSSTGIHSLLSDCALPYFWWLRAKCLLHSCLYLLLSVRLSGDGDKQALLRIDRLINRAGWIVKHICFSFTRGYWSISYFLPARPSSLFYYLCKGHSNWSRR